MGNNLLTYTKTATIAVSGTTSGPVELEDYEMIGLHIPALDSSTLKLQVNADPASPPGSGTWYDVYDGLGNQILNLPASTGSRYVATRDLADILGAHWVRVVCGSAQNSAARTFTFYLRGAKRT